MQLHSRFITQHRKGFLCRLLLCSKQIIYEVIEVNELFLLRHLTNFKNKTRYFPLYQN